MDYRKLFPVVDFANPYTFDHCTTMQDFLRECVSIYFAISARSETEDRIKESCLSVYMAFRDHFPEYMEYLDQEVKERLDFEVERANPKVIKLRRIVIGAIAKHQQQHAA